MPDIASALKAEISRIARKEVRAETQALRKAVTAYRVEIVALKRRAGEFDQQLRRLGKATVPAKTSSTEDEPSGKMRFSSKGFATTRARLGLSAEECGQLVGASGQSVYNWEKGEARPRQKHLAAIAAFRKMGKKEARARLAEFAGSDSATG